MAVTYSPIRNLTAHQIFLLHTGKVLTTDGVFEETLLARLQRKPTAGKKKATTTISRPLLRRLQSRTTLKPRTVSEKKTEPRRPQTAMAGSSNVDNDDDTVSEPDEIPLPDGAKEMVRGQMFGADLLFSGYSRAKERWRRAMRGVRAMLQDRAKAKRATATRAYLEPESKRPSRLLEVVNTVHARRRTDSAVALTDSAVLILDFYVYDAVEYAYRCQMRDHVVEFLHSSFPHCAKWPYPKLRRLASCLSLRVYQKGAVIRRQGQLPDVVYIIYKGAVTCFREVGVTRSRKFPMSSDQWEVQLTSSVLSVPLWSVEAGGLVGEEAFAVSTETDSPVIQGSAGPGVPLARCEGGRSDFTIRAGSLLPESKSNVQAWLERRKQKGSTEDTCTVLALPKRSFWTLFQRREELQSMREQANRKRLVAAGKYGFFILQMSVCFSSLPTCYVVSFIATETVQHTLAKKYTESHQQNPFPVTLWNPNHLPLPDPGFRSLQPGCVYINFDPVLSALKPADEPVEYDQVPLHMCFLRA